MRTNSKEKLKIRGRPILLSALKVELDRKRPANNWCLNTKNHTLAYKAHGKVLYEINLELCNSGTGIADWIFQVARKDWCTPKILGDLVFKLKEVLKPQKYFCSWGGNKRILPKDMAEFLKERYRDLNITT